MKTNLSWSKNKGQIIPFSSSSTFNAWWKHPGGPRPIEKAPLSGWHFKLSVSNQISNSIFSSLFLKKKKSECLFFYIRFSGRICFDRKQKCYPNCINPTFMVRRTYDIPSDFHSVDVIDYVGIRTTHNFAVDRLLIHL